MGVSKGHFFQRVLCTLPCLPWHVLCSPLRDTFVGLRGASCFNKYQSLSSVLFKTLKSESKYPSTGNPVTATISCFPQLSQVQGHRNWEMLLVYLFPAARRIWWMLLEQMQLFISMDTSHKRPSYNARVWGCLYKYIYTYMWVWILCICVYEYYISSEKRIWE